jgi:outer membrane protein assembly factor BamA
VIITVTEAPFVTVEAGAGIEADPVRDLARARAQYTHRNLGRGLQKGVVGGSVGYAFLPSALQFFTSDKPDDRSGLVADLRAEIAQPRILRQPVDGFVATDYQKDVWQAFRFQRLGTRLGLVFHPDRLPQFSFAPSINYEYYFDVQSPGEVTSGIGQQPNRLETSGCGTARQGQRPPETCGILYGELRLNLDFRDDHLSARRGFFFTTNFQYAGGPLSDFNYLRVSPELRVYLPVSRSFTFATRGRYGLLQPIGETRAPPGVARFFGGGATSVRTASAMQLGPRDFQVVPNPNPRSPNPFLAGAPTPRGGNRLLEGSVELRWQQPGSNLALASFFDLGGIDESTSEAPMWLPRQLQYGPGVGVRYHSLFGPVRLDFAWRLPSIYTEFNAVRGPEGFQPSGTYVIAEDCDGFGAGRCFEDTRWQIFLTLGESF